MRTKIILIICGADAYVAETAALAKLPPESEFKGCTGRKFDEVYTNEAAMLHATKPVPHVHYSKGTPSKSKAKPHRPMIRRTC